MSRYAMGIEYNGAAFAGWQVQPDQSTVQEAVERALSSVANHPVQVVCAGRTDAGVHATGQVVHFDSDAPRTTWAWVLGANANLPRTVAAIWAQQVPDAFHARFDALSRSYRYELLNRATRPGIDHDRVAWQHRPLDVPRMHDAAQALLGEHDFSAFRAQACQAKTPVRTMHRLEVGRVGDRVVFDLNANAFLHHMVRNLVGSLMLIGYGERDAAWLRQVLESRDRSKAAATASPAGLCLVAVEYPTHYGLPSTRT
ncbi:MAG: tRNA pseudouridine(38-40) synthase TruA [Xanthomonadaceae bacterium]|nr:tRNA pseudouridine(38-40) synthase TruA [Xanthomonadaceae bacterium]